MNKFASAFRKARLSSDKTFREISKFAEISIGYLSDIENGRRNPPEQKIIKKIEEFFGITDQHLIKLAEEHRSSIPASFNSIFKEKPQLKEILYRADKLPPQELKEIEDLLSRMEEKNNK